MNVGKISKFRLHMSGVYNHCANVRDQILLTTLENFLLLFEVKNFHYFRQKKRNEYCYFQALVCFTTDERGNS